MAKITFGEKKFGPRYTQFSGMTSPRLRFVQQHSVKAVFSDYLSQDKHSSSFPPTFEFLTLNSDKERPSK